MVLYNFAKPDCFHTHLCSAQSHSIFHPKREPIQQMGWPVSNVTSYVTANIVHTAHTYVKAARVGNLYYKLLNHNSSYSWKIRGVSLKQLSIWIFFGRHATLLLFGFTILNEQNRCEVISNDNS